MPQPAKLTVHSCYSARQSRHSPHKPTAAELAAEPPAVIGLEEMGVRHRVKPSDLP